MNDFRKVEDYHKTRPIYDRREFLEYSDMLLKYYNKYKKEYIKFIRAKGFITNNIIDSLFTKVIDEKELNVKDAYIIDAFFDIVIELTINQLDSVEIDELISIYLNKSLSEVVQV